jgi:DNA mismatch repair protein MutS2
VAFSKNEKVFVRTLRRWGKILKVLKESQYRVVVENMEVVCRESDLSKDAPTKKDRPNYKAPKRSHPAIKPVKNPRSLERLDLHGMTVVEAIAAVEKRIDEAIIGDIDRLEIIHGIGTGRLMTAIHQYLTKLSVIESYKMDMVNPGVTWVYF